MGIIDRMEAIPLSQVRLLEGPFKGRQDLLENYLSMVEADRLLSPFREAAGLVRKAERYGGWEQKHIAGHSLGHYLSAISFFYASTGNEHMLERVNYIVDELAACQSANGDGYLMTLPKQLFEDVRAGKIETSGFSLNGIWVPFYTMHKVMAGLRDAFRCAGNRKALEIERNHAGWLDGILCGLSEEQIQTMLCCEHGGMNEVLADLTLDTGDRKYLIMASRYFHHNTVLDPILRCEDKLNGLHGNTQIPKVVGLAREYELTGDPKYRAAAETFWDNVVNRRSYAIGGHGESEHFFPPEKFPEKLTPFTAETCNTYNMLKLTKHLFSWDSKPEYMDFVERALINHLLANIGRKPGEFGYFLGLGSVGVKVFSTPFDAWWCCFGTGMENPARYGEQIYSHSAGTLWVNLFIASELSWAEKGVRLRQETGFPGEQNVRIAMSCGKPAKFALKIRHPYWCRNPEVKINGTIVEKDSAPSSYMTFERAWNDGDILDIELPMHLWLEALPHSDGRSVALMKGPIVMAGIVPADPRLKDPAKERYGEHLKARGKTDDLPPVFVATSADEVISCFKSACKGGDEYSSSNLVRPYDAKFKLFYQVYEEHYAVYFPLMTPDEWKEREAELRADKEEEARLEAATLDTVEPGFQQSEVEHALDLDMENSQPEDFQYRKKREARNGGWFSYEMAVDPVRPVSLVATYWGGEWHAREFDILVDGEKITTQRLHVNRPGDYFDVRYHIPAKLAKGKGKVVVRFQAPPGGIAGGVFRLRMMLDV
ncbi:MAG: hypothetical protein A2X48_00140 [Lentisphaerae bacterium GWF2_49_21]|nr:MAG: hypothetical protein A2X48_00140 [Lentisphaerae bacterium GWF2_49_21]